MDNQRCLSEGLSLFRHNEQDMQHIQLPKNLPHLFLLDTQATLLTFEARFTSFPAFAVQIMKKLMYKEMQPLCFYIHLFTA